MSSSSDYYQTSPPKPDQGAVAAGIIISLLILLLIACVSCYCARKARKSELRSAVAPPPPPLSVIQVWEVDAPTMEKFFHELAREKAVRFTAQQLFTFTNNYATLLGCGGFGKVYKGQFPNGVKIAVKVLNRGASHNIEAQFMAEVETIGRRSKDYVHMHVWKK